MRRPVPWKPLEIPSNWALPSGRDALVIGFGPMPPSPVMEWFPFAARWMVNESAGVGSRK